MKNLNKLFFIAILLCFYSCKTNNYIKYHRIINEAEYSFYNEDYQNASILYGKAFKKVKKPVEVDMYYYAACLWEIGECEKSISLMDTMFYLEVALTQSGYFQGMDWITMKELIDKKKKKLQLSIKEEKMSLYWQCLKQ